MSDEERKTVAYHEAGHALVAVHVPQAEPVHKVTIIPRERAMGLTEQLPEGDKYLFRRDYITDRLAVMMGGRAAEEVVIGEITSGAANDLKQSYAIARQMVLEWGMSSRFGHVAFGSGEREVFLGSEIGHQRQYSDATAREIDDEVQSILNEAYERAKSLVQKEREGLDRLATELLETEEVTRGRVEELLGVS